MKTYSTIITKESFTSTYKGDSIGLLDEYLVIFKNEMPGIDILGIQDSLIEDGSNYNYSITIEY